MVFAQDIPQEAETTGNVCPASNLFHAYMHAYAYTVHTAQRIHTNIHRYKYCKPYINGYTQRRHWSMGMQCIYNNRAEVIFMADLHQPANQPTLIFSIQSNIYVIVFCLSDQLIDFNQSRTAYIINTAHGLQKKSLGTLSTPFHLSTCHQHSNTGWLLNKLGCTISVV